MRSARPYRSHKYPACARCHKRRSRCTIDKPGEACLLCRVSGAVCSAESTSRTEAGPKVGFIQRTAIRDVTSSNHTHVISPVVARDTLVLDTLIPGIGDSATSGSHQQTSPSASKPSFKPVYHARAPARRPSLPTCTCVDLSATSLLQQTQPIFDELVEVYFENLHPCLPLLDEQKLRSLFLKRELLPKTFLLTFVAYMVFYWRKQHNAASAGKIDQDFAWQAGVKAMNGDSQHSDMFSLLAIALCIAGRPSVGVVHNTNNVARITALAHSIGMNHDCSEWSLSLSEKDTRCKLWWAILIHDRWFNFAQGTPPYINQDHYDVPIPKLGMLVALHPDHKKHYKAAECYVQLCKLTEIVGEILPIIYHVRSGNERATTERRLQADTALNAWLDDQPEGFDLLNVDNREPIPGLPNLQLSYLATRMLLQRIAWHEDVQSADDVESSCLQKCLSVAEDIARFVRSLEKRELAGFWLPYNAHHFTSAVTLLLRCAVQTKNETHLEAAMSSARRLVDSLISFRDMDGWDLATTVLPQSERMLSKVEEAMPVINARLQDQKSSQITGNDDSIQQLDSVQWGAQERPFPSIEFRYQDSIEAMFPELFSEFADNAFFDSQF